MYHKIGEQNRTTNTKTTTLRGVTAQPECLYSITLWRDEYLFFIWRDFPFTMRWERTSARSKPEDPCPGRKLTDRLRVERRIKESLKSIIPRHTFYLESVQDDQ